MTGLYKENWGGVRLENTVYIKDIKEKVQIESFSKFKFEEKLIDYTMLTEQEDIWVRDWQNRYYE